MDAGETGRASLWKTAFLLYSRDSRWRIALEVTLAGLLMLLLLPFPHQEAKLAREKTPELPEGKGNQAHPTGGLAEKAPAPSSARPGGSTELTPAPLTPSLHLTERKPKEGRRPSRALTDRLSPVGPSQGFRGNQTESLGGRPSLRTAPVPQKETFASAQGTIAHGPLQQQVSPSPEVTSSTLSSAQKLLRQGRLKEAVRLLEEALGKDPNQPILHLWLARGYQWLHQPQKALREADVVLELLPGDPQALMEQAQAHLALGHLTAAEASLKELLAHTPRNAAAHVLLAQLYNRQGRYPEALLAARSASSLDPNLAGAYLQEGIALYRQGLYTDALGPVEKAVQLRPQAVEPRLALAWLYYSLGRYSDAVAEAREAITMQPQNPWAHYVLGMAYAGEGKLEEARKEYQELSLRRPRLAVKMLHRILEHASSSKKEEEETDEPDVD